MPETNPIDGESWRGQAVHLAEELSRMIDLRRELVQLETRQNLRAARRLAAVGGTGAVLTLVGMPVLIAWIAYALDRWTGLNFWPAMLILATGLTIPGVVLVMHAITVFRRDFCGLQSSLAELREDLIWLQEWTGSFGSTSDLPSRRPKI